MNKYCNVLKDLRSSRNVTQTKLASMLSIKQNTYSQYEAGQRSLPISVLIKLAKFYQVSTDYILGMTEIDTPYPKI